LYPSVGREFFEADMIDVTIGAVYFVGPGFGELEGCLRGAHCAHRLEPIASIDVKGIGHNYPSEIRKRCAGFKGIPKLANKSIVAPIGRIFKSNPPSSLFRAE
jgi:hypothetical protein